MLKILIFFTAILVTQHSFATSVADSQDSNTLIMVDRSSSMAFEIGEIKTAVQAIVRRYPKEHAFGLMAFDGCGQDRVDMLVPMKAGTRDQVAAAVRRISADGWTDLGAAFERARQIMVDTGECPRLVVFTDNMDTCGMDVDGIRTSIDLMCMEVNFITSSTQEDVVGYFSKIVEETGGRVYSGKESKLEKLKALEEIRKRKAKQRKRSVSGNPADSDGDGNGDDPGDPKPKEKKKKKKKARARSGSNDNKADEN